MQITVRKSCQCFTVCKILEAGPYIISLMELLSYTYTYKSISDQKKKKHIMEIKHLERFLSQTARNFSRYLKRSLHYNLCFSFADLETGFNPLFIQNRYSKQIRCAFFCAYIHSKKMNLFQFLTPIRTYTYYNQTFASSSIVSQ